MYTTAMLYDPGSFRVVRGLRAIATNHEILRRLWTLLRLLKLRDNLRSCQYTTYTRPNTYFDCSSLSLWRLQARLPAANSSRFPFMTVTCHTIILAINHFQAPLPFVLSLDPRSLSAYGTSTTYGTEVTYLGMSND